MEVLRVPPYPITTTWDVPLANHTYLIYVEDVVDHSVETTTVTSSDNATVEYVLPRAKVQFDRDFALKIYDTNLLGDIVVESNLTVYRPYVDPNMLGETASEIAEYKRLEIIARSIIDAYLGNDSATGEGFYNHKLIVQTVGQGNDYIPIWHNPKKILKVYENNVLVFDSEDTETEWEYRYAISPDNSAIMRVETEAYNRLEYTPMPLPVATGDLGFLGKIAKAFPRGYDYTFVLDVGYKAVPPDVEQAAIMLIRDMQDGNNDYYKRFISQYSTDQFNIKFAPEFLKGTGNLIVDRILDGYKGNVIKPGLI
jgi:hypothetical protein